MNNINEEGRFYRTSRDAFGSNFYTEDKKPNFMWGVVVVILLLAGFL